VRPVDAAAGGWHAPPAVPGPLPPPGPAAVPESVRQAVATPIGDPVEAPRPGAAEADPVVRIDSRRPSHVVAPSPPRPVFRGDVARADGAAVPALRRPRRTEPLRSR
jgi:hypothetical protein